MQDFCFFPFPATIPFPFAWLVLNLKCIQSTWVWYATMTTRSKGNFRLFYFYPLFMKIKSESLAQTSIFHSCSLDMLFVLLLNITKCLSFSSIISRERRWWKRRTIISSLHFAQGLHVIDQWFVEYISSSSFTCFTTRTRQRNLNLFPSRMSLKWKEKESKPEYITWGETWRYVAQLSS